VGIKTSGGHSSRPPINHTSAAAVMARVIGAIDRHPLPPLLKQPVTDFLLALAPRWVGVLAAGAGHGADQGGS
jgi:hypothetical protein